MPKQIYVVHSAAGAFEVFWLLTVAHHSAHVPISVHDLMHFILFVHLYVVQEASTTIGEYTYLFSGLIDVSCIFEHNFFLSTLLIALPPFYSIYFIQPTHVGEISFPLWALLNLLL